MKLMELMEVIDADTYMKIEVENRNGYESLMPRKGYYFYDYVYAVLLRNRNFRDLEVVAVKPRKDRSDSEPRLVILARKANYGNQEARKSNTKA